MAHACINNEIDNMRWTKISVFILYVYPLVCTLEFVRMDSESSKRWMPITDSELGIYELRAFRRETLFWIIFLNRALTPLSRSTMSISNACNCSSLHTSFLFWNVLETRDHLLEPGIPICFDRRCRVDSSSKPVVSLDSRM